MTIREECVSHTLFLCMMHEISIPYTVISSAVEKSSLHSALSCSFRKSFPLFRYHTYGAIPVCKKDPSASLGMTIWGKRPSKHVRCMKRRISIPLLLGYAPRPVISSAVEKSSLHSVLPCPFRGRLPILLCHTYGAIPVCKKDRGLRSG